MRVNNSPNRANIQEANLQAALSAAKAGYRVFQCSPTKRSPMNAGWQDHATTDPDAIRRRWADNPHAIPGIVTGPNENLAVIDPDMKNGKDGLGELRRLGFDPDAMSPICVETPTGGRHLYFQCPEGMAGGTNRIALGVDVKASGGLVIAPGAVEPRGTYRLVSGSLSGPLPEWPDYLPIRRKAIEPGEGEPTGLPFHVIKSALESVPNDDAFDSRDAWLDIGMAIHAETDGSDKGCEAWHAWSRQHAKYNADHTDAAYESFKAGGGITGWRIIREAEKRGWSDPALTELRRQELNDDFDPCWTPAELAEAMVLPGVELAEIDALVGAPRKAGHLTFHTPGECAELKPRPYVVKGLIGAGDLAAIVGAPGTGKSLLGPRLAYAVAQGREAFGRRVRQGGVFYVAAEDHHGMASRLSGLKADHGEADALSLVGGVSDLLSEDVKGKGSRDYRALRDAVKDRRPSMVIIDTLAMAFAGLEENASEAMGRVVAVARSLTKWGAAVILIHHDTKAGDGLARGHSVLNGALDMSLWLRKSGNMVTVQPTKNRNGTSEQELAFRIEERVVGEDEDGDPIKAAIAVETDPSDAPIREPTGQKKEALTVLSELVGTGAGVSKDDWRKACHGSTAFSASDDQSGKNKAFRRAVETLAREGWITERDGLFTIATIAGDFDDLE